MIRSEQFDDIYFSREDGLAETKHVFLDGNALPEAWAGRRLFTIAETGFGTGLNFLAAWTLFEETADEGTTLDYVSFELYPLAAAQIQSALSHWSGAFGGRLEKLIQTYPMRVPGWHRIDLGRVRLTLVFDDVNLALPRLIVPHGVDAWFLDGFAPAKNPQMWNDGVFAQMARLSHAETTLASFTAAGVAKNGLREAGFSIEKRKGYGRKRDMIAGRFTAGGPRTEPSKPGKIAIVGGGLAGTACARALRQRGLSPVLFEAGLGLAGGASGNSLGLINPRFSAQRTAEADFYSAGFALAARNLAVDAGFLRCGSLHLLADADKTKKLTACKANWSWPDEHMRLVSPLEASEIAGVAIQQPALWLPDSGQVSPRRLCDAWAAHCDIRLNATFTESLLDSEGFDQVILACGIGVRDFSDLPLHTVRGQLTVIEASPQSTRVKTNLCYGGYLSAPQNGRHILGSTFQKWLETTETREEDDKDMLDLLDQAVPGLGLDHGRVSGGRAALRCSAKDRFPVIGPLPERPGYFVSTGHGSHGIISALAGANLLADQITGTPLSLPGDTAALLGPQRFADRAQKSRR